MRTAYTIWISNITTANASVVSMVTDSRARTSNLNLNLSPSHTYLTLVSTRVARQATVTATRIALCSRTRSITTVNVCQDSAEMESLIATVLMNAVQVMHKAVINMRNASMVRSRVLMYASVFKVSLVMAGLVQHRRAHRHVMRIHRCAMCKRSAFTTKTKIDTFVCANRDLLETDTRTAKFRQTVRTVRKCCLWVEE